MLAIKFLIKWAILPVVILIWVGKLTAANEQFEGKLALRSTVQAHNHLTNKEIFHGFIDLRDESINFDDNLEDFFTLENNGEANSNEIGSDEGEPSQQEIDENQGGEVVSDSSSGVDYSITSVMDLINQTIPGLGYLGTGYDFVFGNPLGDPKTMLDPGYRPPILNLKWEKSPPGISNDLKNLQPLGGWIRDEVACRKAESVEKLNTMSDYRKSLSVDASVSGSVSALPISFSASVGYSNAAHVIENKNLQSFMMRTYCNRYVAGVDLVYSERDLKKSFISDLEYLPKKFDGLKETSECSTVIFKNDEDNENCIKNVKPWMDFFKKWGTHVVDTVHLGGKMTHQIQVSQSDLKKMREAGTSVSAEVSAFTYSGSTSVSTSSAESKQSNKYGMSKTTIVLGGYPPQQLNDPAQLYKWAKTVEQLPMPVKINLTPFDKLSTFDEHGISKAYGQALEYYGLVYGMTQQDLEAITGVQKTFTEILKQSTTINYAGPPPGFAVCPPGKVVLFGFALHLNTCSSRSLKKFHMNVCKSGSEKCNGGGSQLKKYDDSRIWAVCGTEAIPFSTQIMAESSEITTTATCPENMVIAFGFGLSAGISNRGAGQVDLYACRNGLKQCSKQRVKLQESYTNRNYVWILCVEKTVVGYNKLHSKTKNAPRGKCQSSKGKRFQMRCPKKSDLVSGFALQFHNEFNRNDVRKTFKVCGNGICKTVASRYCYGPTLFYEGNYQTLAGFAICSKEGRADIKSRKKTGKT